MGTLGSRDFSTWGSNLNLPILTPSKQLPKKNAIRFAYRIARIPFNNRTTINELQAEKIHRDFSLNTLLPFLNFGLYFTNFPSLLKRLQLRVVKRETFRDALT